MNDDIELTDEDIARIKESIESGTVHHPEWVRSGTDFIEWMEQIKAASKDSDNPNGVLNERPQD